MAESYNFKEELKQKIVTSVKGEKNVLINNNNQF